MIRKYYKAYYGSHEAVEAGIRKFDQIFRRMYNVYGGKREYSGKDADGNYEVVMSYTANWVEVSFLPEFTIEAINHRFNHEADRLANQDFWCDVIKEG